jgi:hypothetical protein
MFDTALCSSIYLRSWYAAMLLHVLTKVTIHELYFTIYFGTEVDELYHLSHGTQPLAQHLDRGRPAPAASDRPQPRPPPAPAAPAVGYSDFNNLMGSPAKSCLILFLTMFIKKVF